jgi:hypothetical protein
MNKIMHAIVLALFGAACGFVSLILRLPHMAARGRPLPAFSILCMAVEPYLLLGLALAATAYCLRVWVRKTDAGNSWVAFLATTIAALGLVMLPTIVALYLPLVDSLNQLARR